MIYDDVNRSMLKSEATVSLKFTFVSSLVNIASFSLSVLPFPLRFVGEDAPPMAEGNRRIDYRISVVYRRVRDVTRKPEENDVASSRFF